MTVLVGILAFIGLVAIIFTAVFLVNVLRERSRIADAMAAEIVMQRLAAIDHELAATPAIARFVAMIPMDLFNEFRRGVQSAAEFKEMGTEIRPKLYIEYEKAGVPLPSPVKNELSSLHPHELTSLAEALERLR